MIPESRLRPYRQPVEAPMPQIAQPSPMYGQPAPQGPQMQWQSMPDPNQDTGKDVGAAAGGLNALLKRFKKPQTSLGVDSPMPGGGIPIDVA